jgi:hypothetical protein
MATTNSNGRDVGNGGHLTCKITVVSQDENTLTSRVRVEGFIQNQGDGRSSGWLSNTWIGGDRSYNAAGYTFDLGVGESVTFIEHTFTMQHGDRGNLDVTFHVNYANSGTGTFGNNEGVSCSLTLDRIKTVPSVPRNLNYENLTPTSITLLWDKPDDDGGYNVTNYIIKRYDGGGTQGNFNRYQSPKEARNLTDLIPGQEYTYTIQAFNKAQYRSGLSEPSDKLTVTSRTGVFMRHHGSWVRVQPYVRDAGIWKPVETFVRKINIWRPTNN